MTVRCSQFTLHRAECVSHDRSGIGPIPADCCSGRSSRRSGRGTRKEQATTSDHWSLRRFPAGARVAAGQFANPIQCPNLAKPPSPTGAFRMTSSKICCPTRRRGSKWHHCSCRTTMWRQGVPSHRSVEVMWDCCARLAYSMASSEMETTGILPAGDRSNM